MPENNRGQTEILQIPSGGEMPVVEHILIGSGTRVGGMLINLQTVPPLIESVLEGDRQARIHLLAPVFLQDNAFSDQARSLVERRRQEKREEMLPRGYITALALDKMMPALSQGLAFYLELSNLDKSGLIVPVWKFYLLSSKGDIVNDTKTLVSQQIAPDYPPGFSLGDVQLEQRKGKPVFYRTINLNLGI